MDQVKMNKPRQIPILGNLFSHENFNPLVHAPPVYF